LKWCVNGYGVSEIPRAVGPGGGVISVKVGGKDVVSDRTERSARFLVTVSALVILVEAHEVPMQDLTILGVTAPPQLFGVVVLFVVLYTLVSLFVNWSGDVIAWREWKRRGRVIAVGSSDFPDLYAQEAVIRYYIVEVRATLMQRPDAVDGIEFLEGMLHESRKLNRSIQKLY
jgi:hypothetical protein